MGIFRLMTVVFIMSIAGGAIALAILINAPLITYPAVAAAIGALLAVSYTVSSTSAEAIGSSRSKALTPQRTRVIDALVFCSIAALAVFAHLTPSGISDWFLVGSVAIAALVGYRIYRGGRSPLLCLTEIILLTLAIRAALWYSYPVYGQDSLIHTAIGGYIATTGELIPEGISYYRLYPGAHILTAAGMFVTGTSSKQSFMLTTGIVYAVSLVAVYIFSLRVVDDRRGALLATLLCAVSTGPLHRGSELYAQTLAEALFTIIVLVLLYRNDRNRRTIVVFVLFAALLVTHNLHPIVLGGTIVLIAVARFSVPVLRQLVRVSPTDENVVSTIPWTLAGIVGISAVYLWIVIDYLAYQVNRIVLIFSISSGTVQDAVTSVNAEAPPTVEVFGTTFPDTLLWAAPLLVIGGITAFASLVVLSDFSESISGDSSRPLPLYWLSVSFLLSGGFALAYAAGGSGPVIRALAAVTVLLTPMFAFAVTRLRLLAIPRPIHTAIMIGVVLCVALSGVLSPSVAMPLRDDNSFVPRATATDVKATEFAVDRVPSHSIVGDNYISSYASSRKLNQGDSYQSPFQVVLWNGDPDTAGEYASYSKNGTASMLYRQEYNSYYDVRPPQSLNQIYTAGNTSVFVP